MIRVAIQSDASRLSDYCEQPIRATGTVAAVRCVGARTTVEAPCVDSLDALLATEPDAFVLDVVDDAFLPDAMEIRKPTLVDLGAVTTDRLAQIKRHADRLLVGQPLRFEPANAAVSQAIRSGRLGQLGLVRMHAWYSLSGCCPALVHLADLACWLFDQTPLSVYAVGSQSESGDFAQLHLGFDAGGMALIDRSSQLPGHGRYVTLSAIGADGATYADEHHNQQLLFTGEQPGVSATRPTSSCQARQLAAFVSYVDDGSSESPFLNANEIERALAVVAAAEESQRTCAPVRLQAGG